MPKQKTEPNKKEGNRKWVLLGIFVVAATMISSGLFLGTQTPNQVVVNNNVNVVDANYTLDFVQQGVITYINESLSEFVVIPTKFSGSNENIIDIKNTSVNGIKSINFEMASNKDFILFKFIIDPNSNETEDKILENIKAKFRYQMEITDVHKDIYRGFYGYVMGIPEKAYLIANTDAKPGDYIFGTWYNRNINQTTDNLVLIQDSIRLCESVPAKVASITDVIVRGEIYENFNLNRVNKELNTSIAFIKPKIINITAGGDKITEAIKKFGEKFNSTITTDNITNITTIISENFTIIAENKTENTTNKTRTYMQYIEFQSSLPEIKSILEYYNILSSVEKGSINFKISYSSWNAETENKTKEILDKENVKEIVMESEGFISVPEACIEEKTLVSIKDNLNFKAVLNLTSGVGSKVNVRINTYMMSQGEQNSYIPYIATQE